jgi:hypothetical protein
MSPAKQQTVDFRQVGDVLPPAPQLQPWFDQNKAK